MAEADEHRQEGTWSPGGELNTRRDDEATGTLLPDGRVLLVGGRKDLAEETTEIWNPEVRVSERAASTVEPRAGHAATALKDGRVLVVGDGWGPDRAAETVEVYDPDEDKWSIAGELQHARMISPMALRTVRLSDGRVLIVGGYDADANVRGTAEVFDPKSDSLEPVASLNQARREFSMVALDDGGALVAGGNTEDGYTASAEVYDPDEDEWSSVESMRFTRRAPNAVRLPDGRVLVAGGSGWLVPGEAEDGSDDITAEDATDLDLDTSDQDQSFEFTIEQTNLGSNETVTVGLDSAQAGGAEYVSDDASYDSADGEVTATVGEETVELAFAPEETITAGTTVTIDGDGVASTEDVHEEHEAVFTRTDTGGREAAVFVITSRESVTAVEIFDPDTGTWDEAAPIRDEWAGTTSLTLLDDGTVLLTDGKIAARYDPEDDEWWAADDPEDEHRWNSPKVLLDNGHLFSGGTEGEVYSPETVLAPVVESVSPERGTTEGDFEITITGENLADAIFVTIGEHEHRITDVIEDSSEQIRIEAPTHPAEWAPVVVATAGGFSDRDDALQVEFVADDGAWHPTGDPAGTRTSPGTVIFDGPACEGESPPDYCGEVLIVGGSSSERYDPDTGQFGDTASLPTSVHAQAQQLTTLLDGPACRGEEPAEHCGKVLTLDRSQGDTHEAVFYDPEANEWQACGEDTGFACPPEKDDQWENLTLIDGPECHEPDGEAPAHCGKVLANLFDLGDEPPMWLFDPATGEWEETTLPDAKRERFGMVLVDGPRCEGDEVPDACGNVLITGGIAHEPGGGPRVETAELYDPETEEWRETAEKPAPGRARSTVTQLEDGRLLVAGGRLEAQPPIDQAEIFDPADESWEPVSAMPAGRQAHGATRLRDGRVLLAGGWVAKPNGDQAEGSSAVVFDPDTGEWRYTDSMQHSRIGERTGSRDKPLGLVTLPNGQVLAVDGDDDGNTAEVFELASGAVAGNVSDAETGDPVEGAEVTVTDSGDPVGSATTDSSGSYRVDGVPFGEYTVTADADGFEAESREDVAVEAGETTMAEFALTPETDSGGGGGTGGGDTGGDDTTDETTTEETEQPGSISGTVSDVETGDAVAGAEITVLADGTTVVTAGTDEQGAYTITGLDPGDYTLSVEADGFLSTSQDVTVESGETVTASFSLEPAAEVGDVEGTVTDADSGDPVVGAEITVLADGAEVVTAGTDVDGTYFVRNLQPGEYTFTVEADGFEQASQTVTITAGETATVDFSLQATDAPVEGLEATERVAGADRFATAAELSAQRFDPGVEVAYVATGLEFADALTGGVAAALENGPVLLAATDLLPDATAAELDRLDPQRIVLLGGTAALSDTVETAVAEFTNGSVDRLAGPDRFATAAEVSGALFPDGADTVYVGTGLNFPDVLAGGPAAAGAPGPMLLTTGDTVPQATADELDRLDPDRVVILGGTAAVGEAVEAELADHGAVDRIGGAGRFATAAELSASEFADAAAVDRVYVATGFEFADALAAGAVAGSEDVPVLLVTTDSVPEPTAAELGRLDPDEVVVMGGTAAVADSVEQQLIQLLGG